MSGTFIEHGKRSWINEKMMRGPEGGERKNVYEMRYLTEQDMPYFRRLAEEGKAIIIELTDQALLQIDPDSFQKLSGEIDRKSLEEALHRQESVLTERSREGALLSQEIKEMEKLLDSSGPVIGDQEEAGLDAALQVEQMKKVFQELIRDYMHELRAERKEI